MSYFDMASEQNTTNMFHDELMMKLKQHADAINSLLSAYENKGCYMCYQIRHLASQFQQKETEQMSQAYIKSISCYTCFEKNKQSLFVDKNEKYFGFGSTIGMNTPSPPQIRMFDEDTVKNHGNFQSADKLNETKSKRPSHNFNNKY